MDPACQVEISKEAINLHLWNCPEAVAATWRKQANQTSCY
jgi:hypothetical protein